MVRERDVVKDNAIFREKVRKEKKVSSLNENFDFNPKNLVVVADKPTKKFELIDRSQDDNAQQLQSKLGTLTAMPKQKFQYPQTSSQEIGWDMDTEFHNHVIKEPKGKKQCAETTYCDNFYLFQHRSPFVAVKTVTAEPAKK